MPDFSSFYPPLEADPVMSVPVVSGDFMERLRAQPEGAVLRFLHHIVRGGSLLHGSQFALDGDYLQPRHCVDGSEYDFLSNRHFPDMLAPERPYVWATISPEFALMFAAYPKCSDESRYGYVYVVSRAGFFTANRLTGDAPDGKSFVSRLPVRPLYAVHVGREDLHSPTKAILRMLGVS